MKSITLPIALLLACSACAQQLFDLLPPAQTGVDFVNRIEENTEEDNVLTYEYFYNGGGVAAGDLNNDGLPELFFTSNRESNRLYFNLGGLQFKDITRAAGVGGRRKDWKTGVTFADVNADGWLDIYVCYSGRGNDDSRRNQLFINNRDLTFSEMAAAYGLDDPGYGTQAAFFDYDLDGDLDCFVLNHNIKEYRNFENDEVRKTRDPLAGDRLYENQNGRFADVSERAGIPGNPLGFGLGLAVGDVNADGWPDIYVGNDYNEPDYLLLNDGAGHFADAAPQALGHMSHFSMGCDIADFNNDGLPDILTLDMLPEDNRRQKLLQGPENYDVYEMMVRSGRHHQFMRNMLHLNGGRWMFDAGRAAADRNETSGSGAAGDTSKPPTVHRPPTPFFAEVGQLAGISNTDWSWSALFADFDNDGWKDILITNGYLRDYTNRDFLRFWGDYLIKKAAAAETPSLLELVQKMPSSRIKNYLFRNNGDLTFSNMTDAWGLSQPAVSNGSTYADLDGDGDLEIVVNNINEPAFIYKNNARETNGNHYLQVRFAGASKNTFGVGARVCVRLPGDSLICVEMMPTRGYQSAVPELLHIGLGKHVPSELEIAFAANGTPAQTVLPAGSVGINRVHVLDLGKITTSARPSGESNAFAGLAQLPPGTDIRTVGLRHVEYDYNDFKRQPLLPYMLSRCGPAMAAADVNGDGRDDLFFGGSKWNPGQVYLQTGEWNFQPSADPVFRNDLFCTDAGALFFDADADGDPDLYLASGGYADYGDDKDPNLEDRLYFNRGDGYFFRRDSVLPPMPFSKSCARAADADADGDLDLFVGGRVIPGYYPIAPPSYLLLNDGAGRFSKAPVPGFPERLGMVTDAAWADLNADGRPDLVVCGEWMPLRIFLNAGGVFEERSADYFEKPCPGLWNCLLVRDLDGDGDTDILAGNFGRNSQLKASDREPLTLVYKDFDGNGSVDPILCAYVQGTSYPFLTRDELLGQIAAMRPRFTSYEQFSTAVLSDMFTPEELQGADTLRASCLETTFFENTGGRFRARPLPPEAQFAPVFVLAEAPDSSGVLLFGNQCAARLRLGRMDANGGLALRYEPGRGFVPVAAPFQLRDDVRSAITLTAKDIPSRMLLLGFNNSRALAFVYPVK